MVVAGIQLTPLYDKGHKDSGSSQGLLAYLTCHNMIMFDKCMAYSTYKAHTNAFNSRKSRQKNSKQR